MGGGAVDASRSIMTKLLIGGTKLSTTANMEFGSRLIGSHSIQGIMMMTMTGVISPCASRISLTADPIAAMIAPIVK